MAIRALGKCRVAPPEATDYALLHAKENPVAPGVTRLSIRSPMSNTILNTIQSAAPRFFPLLALKVGRN
jgi:hypothetical protein